MRQRELPGLARAFETSEPTSSDTLSPTSLQLLSLLREFLELDTTWATL